MAVIGNLAKSGLLGIAGLLGAKKSSKPPAPLPTATRDDAQAAQLANDELARRKGGAADILNGSTGAEAALAGGKLTLGR